MFSKVTLALTDVCRMYIAMCYVFCEICYEVCPMCIATLGNNYSTQVDTGEGSVFTPSRTPESPCWKDAAVGIINTPGT